MKVIDEIRETYVGIDYTLGRVVSKIPDKPSDFIHPKEMYWKDAYSQYPNNSEPARFFWLSNTTFKSKAGRGGQYPLARNANAANRVG